MTLIHIIDRLNQLPKPVLRRRKRFSSRLMPISSVLTVVVVVAVVAADAVTEVAVYVSEAGVGTGEIVRPGLLRPSRSMTRLHSRLFHE